jgi:cytochrome c
MQSEDSQQITKRFFEAIYELKKQKVIRGKYLFTNRCNIGHQNFYKLEKNPESFALKNVYIKYLVEDHNISAHWIITGQGSMFDKSLNN